MDKPNGRSAPPRQREFAKRLSLHAGTGSSLQMRWPVSAFLLLPNNLKRRIVRGRSPQPFSGPARLGFLATPAPIFEHLFGILGCCVDQTRKIVVAASLSAVLFVMAMLDRDDAI